MLGYDLLFELRRISETHASVCVEGRALSGYSTMGIGGSAGVFYIPATEEEVRKVISLLRNEKEKFFISGNGSNVLFSDKGFDGVVIKLNESLSPVNVTGTSITVSSGFKLSNLMNLCIMAGFSGLEGVSGIPATVGGAIKNNASSLSGAITDTLRRIFVLNEDGELVWVERKDITEGYRFLSWQGGGVILKAEFSLSRSTPDNVKKKIRGVFLDKMKKQPCNMKTLGCIFKNPITSGKPAWELIDNVGMRGRRSGGALVSEKHANFIVNEHNATSDDVLSLISEIKGKVHDELGIRLEEEIEVV